LKNIKLVYLKLNEKKPSLFEKFKDYNLDCIEYTTHIQNWLKKCQAAVEQENELLSKIINQYEKLIFKLTSDVKQATENQQSLSKLLYEKPEEALELIEHLKKNCFEVFKHVQWHTVAKFFDELEIALTDEENEIKAIIEEKPKPEDITKVTHNKTGKSRIRLIIKFTYDGIPLQIASDYVNGLTLGNLTGYSSGPLKDDKWTHFDGKLKGINFTKFESEETFRIINNEYRKERIDEIVTQISEKYEKREKPFEEEKEA